MRSSQSAKRLAPGVALECEGIGKRYQLRQRSAPYRRFSEELAAFVPRLGQRATRAEILWAIRDVSFSVPEGEIFGVIGRNGAGKSTLLKVLGRIAKPTVGHAAVRGRIGSMLEVGVGFHPELTGRENIFLNGAILGMRRSEIDARFDEIVEFAELSRFTELPVKRYSSGMILRLGFSVAAHLDTEILLIDEVLAVGDSGFQQRCMQKMREIARSGRTILFVSHNMPAVMNLCRMCLLLEAGQVTFNGEASAAVQQYLSQRKAASSASLRARTDRSGDGRLQFRDIRFEGDDGRALAEILLGEPARIILGLEKTVAGTLEDLAIQLSLHSASGQLITLLWSEYSGRRFTSTESNLEIRCSLSRVLLAPGEYTLGVGVWQGRTLLDGIENAATLTIVAADPFGTGILPRAEKQGVVLLEQAWTQSQTPASACAD